MNDKRLELLGTLTSEEVRVAYWYMTICHRFDNDATLYEMGEWWKPIPLHELDHDTFSALYGLGVITNDMDEADCTTEDIMPDIVKLLNEEY